LKMFRQLLTCYKAVFFKEDTNDFRRLWWIYCILHQIIRLYDWYCHIVIFRYNISEEKSISN